MLSRALIAIGIVAIAVVVAVVLRRRNRGVDAPTQGEHHVPVQLDRADFARPDAPWLVVVFSSSTCQTCGDVVTKAKVVESPEVAVVEVEYTAQRTLHTKYAIDGVPCLVLADGRGVVRASFLGPVTATDLWASLANARDQPL